MMGWSSYSTIVFILLLLPSFHGKQGLVEGATFTIVNKCSQTVWPAVLGTPKLETTGFQLPKGTSRAFQAPTGWSGRFWGRTGCTFDDDTGSGFCATGDCGSGKIECNGSGATTATLAEFTLGSGGGLDFYDVSLVDGYNLPLLIAGGGGSGRCEATGCVEDLNKECPAELKTENGGACRSACGAFGTPEYCCNGEYGSPTTCKSSAYSRRFKDACPKSYSYAYDDETSTFTCAAADYVITFCPTSIPSQKSAKPDNGTAAGQTGSDSRSGSGEVGIMADGSWLADLATGDSSARSHSLGSATSQTMTILMIVTLLHLFAAIVS